MTIGDANSGATDTLTITLSGAGGVPSGAGLTAVDDDVYTLSGTAAAIDAELDALSFTPTGGAPGTTSTTNFTLTDVTSASTILASFDGADGSNPVAGVFSDAAGDLFGTTEYGGASGEGALYEYVAATGALTPLASFDGSNGAEPTAGLIADAAGDLFGTTNYGDGTIFEYVQATGALVTLANFSGGNGALPQAGLIADAARTPRSATVSPSRSPTNTATATAKVTVSNPADTINGPQYGNGTIEGTSGADIINAFGWYDTIYDNGGADTVNAGSGNATVYTSSGDVVVNLQGYYDVVSGGNGWDTVTGSLGNTSVTLGNGNDTVTTGGYYNTISVGSGDDTINAGLGNATVTAGAGVDTIKIAGYGDNVTLNGSSASVTAGAGQDTVTANGGHDTLAFAGYNDVAILEGTLTASITDSASGLLAKVYSSAETLTITGFGSTDSTGVIELLSGAGGYKIAAAAFAALRSDGHGGEMLSLGASGSIDFSGTSLSKLHASNFAAG